MSIKPILRLAPLCAALLLGTSAEAAILDFAPEDAEVTVGDSIAIKIVGRDFTNGADGTIGGALSVSWDPALLTLTGYTVDFAGDRLFADANTNTALDAVGGTLGNLSVLSLFGVESADFDVATLTFKGVSAGVSSLTLSLGQFESGLDNPWFDADGLLPAEPTFGATSLAVRPVPVPAALPLLAGALAALGGLRRRPGKA
ncbi:MAG: hypothetical protein AB7I01_06375 [Gammaproteobacteria bacterium]